MDNDDLRRAISQLAVITGQAIGLLAQASAGMPEAMENLLARFDGSAETRVEQWLMESLRAGFDRMQAGFRGGTPPAPLSAPGT